MKKITKRERIARLVERIAWTTRISHTDLDTQKIIDDCLRVFRQNVNYTANTIRAMR